jgi:HK97 family phage major capsid protein
MKRGTKMNKILEMKRDLAEKTKEMRSFLDGINGDMTDEQCTQADTMERTIDGIADKLAREERMQQREIDIPTPPASTGRSQEPEIPNIVTGGRSEDVEPGIRMARFIKAGLVSQKESRSLEEVIKRMYPNDKTLENARAMSVGTGSDGGVLVPVSLSSEIIPLLREQGVIRSLGARTIPMPNGNIKINKQTGAANFQWVGENAPIIASKVPLGQLSLSAKKLAGLIPLSNELINDSSISADAFVRNELVNGISESEDITALYGSGSANEPAGIFNTSGITKIDMGALPTSDALANIVGAIMAKKFANKQGFGWVFNGVLWSHYYNLKDGAGNYIHRAEMALGKLFGFDFRICNNVKVGADAHAKTEIYFGDFSQFMIGETLGLQIAVSQEASYMDGSTLVSAFSNDQTVLRAIMREDFGVRYADAFVIATNVWTKA